MSPKTEEQYRKQAKAYYMGLLERSPRGAVSEESKAHIDMIVEAMKGGEVRRAGYRSMKLAYETGICHHLSPCYTGLASCGTTVCR